MRARLTAAAALLLAAACAAPRPPAFPGAGPGAAVRVLTADGLRRVPLEDYVRDVVLAEAGGSRGPGAARMLEVQAIVSRTFAMTPRHRRDGYDFCATTHCQVYAPARAAASPAAPLAARAAAATRGAILRFDRAPARVVYHADCGGHTSAARDVWRGEDPPYLAARPDAGAGGAAHAGWTFAPATPALVAALNTDPRTRVGGRLLRIDVLERDAAGRALVIVLDGERAPVVRGEELRAVVAQAFGARSLRSTRFEVRRAESGFVFTGTGFGHGVGLCQAGALARLAAGARPEEVLAHYFPGTSVR